LYHRHQRQQNQTDFNMMQFLLHYCGHHIAIDVEIFLVKKLPDILLGK